MFEIKNEKDLKSKGVNINWIPDIPSVLNDIDKAEDYFVITNTKNVSLMSEIQKSSVLNKNDI